MHEACSTFVSRCKNTKPCQAASNQPREVQGDPHTSSNAHLGFRVLCLAAGPWGPPM